MKDTIYRQDAIDAVNTALFPKINTAKDAEKALRNLSSAEPRIIQCKDCKYFEYDHMYVIRGIPVMGNLVCNKWGNGCRTKEDGFCFMAERRTDETD